MYKGLMADFSILLLVAAAFSGHSSSKSIGFMERLDPASKVEEL